MFELSGNLCSDFRTMYKNNCVNFSNNSDNLVLWRLNVWKCMKWEKKEVKCVFIYSPRYTPRRDFENFFSNFFLFFCEKIFWILKFNFEKNFIWLKCESFFIFFVLLYWIKVWKFYFDFHLLYLVKVLRCFFYLIC